MTEKGDPRPSTRDISLEDLLESARQSIMGRLPGVPLPMLARSDVSFVHTVLAKHYDVHIEREHTEYPGLVVSRSRDSAAQAAEAKPQQPWTLFRLTVRPRLRPAKPVLDSMECLYRALPAHAWHHKATA